MVVQLQVRGKVLDDSDYIQFRLKFGSDRKKKTFAHHGICLLLSVRNLPTGRNSPSNSAVPSQSVFFQLFTQRYSVTKRTNDSPAPALLSLLSFPLPRKINENRYDDLEKPRFVCDRVHPFSVIDP